MTYAKITRVWITIKITPALLGNIAKLLWYLKKDEEKAQEVYETIDALFEYRKYKTMESHFKYMDEVEKTMFLLKISNCGRIPASIRSCNCLIMMKVWKN